MSMMIEPTRTLVDRSLWFLLPAFAAAGAMVFAMMEHAAALITRRPPARRRHASSREALLERLLALNDPAKPYRIEPGRHADLEFVFDPVDPAFRACYAKVKLTTQYRARLVLDEERHELRWFEMLRGRGGFLGFQGMRPRFSWGIWLMVGYMDARWDGWAYGIRPGFPPRVGEAVRFRVDTVHVKREIRAVAGRAGWTFHPRIWPFQVRRRSDGTIARGPIPSSTRYWSERQFWGTLHVALYVVTVGYILFAAGGWDQLARWSTVLPVLAFSVFWWLVVGGIMWILAVSARSGTR